MGFARVLRHLATDRAGGTAIEFALIVSPLFALIFGGIQCGRVMWIQNALMYSVNQTARCATINTTTCGTTSGIQSYAASLAGAGFSAGDFQLIPDACGNHISGAHTISISFPFFSQDINLTADACYPK
jgi:hypothetical protein